MTAKLIVTAGASRGAQFPLADRIIFNIGSDRASTVFLDDAKVSPNHCRLYKEDSKFTLFDVSGKGLAVNGKKVVKAVLAEGDVVQIGDTEIRFTTSDVAGPAGAPPAGAATAAGPVLRQEGNAPVGANYPAPASYGAPAPAAFGGAAAPAEPRGYARVWLQCVEGNDKGKTFDLSEGNVWVIGRGHSADITVMDIKVSRAHCRIDRQGNTFYLNDLNSTNGSFLNGQQIDRQVLHKGDYIKVGYTILSFQYEEVPEPAQAPAPFAPPAPAYAPAGAPSWGAPPPAPPQPPAWSAPAPAAASAWGTPGPAAAPAPGWRPPGPPDDAKREAAAAENDYKMRGVLDYNEVEGRDDDAKRHAAAAGPAIVAGGQLPPPDAPRGDGRKWGAAPAAPARPPAAPQAGLGDDDVPLDMAALDDDAEFGGAGRAPAPAWGTAPQGAPPAWGAPPPPARPPQPGGWNELPPGPQGALPAPGWGPPGAAFGAPGGGAPIPPPPQRPGKKTSDMMVPDLDADSDLFTDGPTQAGAPPAGWGAPPAAPAWGAPPPAPAGWGQPPQERRHKTGELPVSDYLVRGGPAPPPISSEQNAPVACFLCRRPFTQDDMRQNRLRRIKDNYYCLHCVEQV